MCSLSGGRRLARQRASFDPTPMNHSNKDGISLAESGEGRPLIKENAGQPNTYSTQSGKGVSQGLAGVRKAARENKEMKFTALLHHLTVDLLRESFYSLLLHDLTVDLLRESFYSLLLHDLTVDLLRESFYSLKRKAAPGVDGVTWQEYEKGLEDRLTDLHGRVHRGAYRAMPSRRVYIEKADGRQRPLAVPALGVCRREEGGKTSTRTMQRLDSCNISR